MQICAIKSFTSVNNLDQVCPLLQMQIFLSISIFLDHPVKVLLKYFRRYHRSVEDTDALEAEVTNLVLDAEIADVQDCAKMFICQLNTFDPNGLDSIEAFIQNMFGLDDQGILDLSKLSVRFDLAAVVGRRIGLGQCQNLYKNCQIPYDQLKTIVEGQQKSTNVL